MIGLTTEGAVIAAGLSWPDDTPTGSRINGGIAAAHEVGLQGLLGRLAWGDVLQGPDDPGRPSAFVGRNGLLARAQPAPAASTRLDAIHGFDDHEFPGGLMIQRGAVGRQVIGVDQWDPRSVGKDTIKRFPLE